MVRKCVFVLYDFQGIVSEYVKYLLQETLKVVDKIIVISNCDLDESSKYELSKITEDIIIRQNVGYDIGAYKDFFTTYNKEIEGVDELIIMNDTFYGPFYSWSIIFSEMENEKADFWGLTSAIDKPETTHIQSYFMVFRKNILIDKRFLEFWRNMNIPKSFHEAVINGEVALSQYLYSLGYSSSAYVNLHGGKEYCSLGKNVFTSYASELVRECKLPIMKRKALSPPYLCKNRNCVTYVRDYYQYDIHMIRDHLIRLDKFDKIAPYGYSSLIAFCNQFRKIYIFGYGEIGKGIKKFLNYHSIEIEGYLVSNKEDDETINWKEWTPLEDEAVIIAVSMGLYPDVTEMVLRKVNVDNVYIPR